MRRFIAYILMALSIILAVGVSFVPTFKQMKTGREFTSGREIVFQLVDRSNEENEIPENSSDDVAEEMRKRLNDMNVEDYTVKTQGDDMVSVTFATDDENQFNYIVKYLNFDGGDFALVDSTGEFVYSHADTFEGNEARIEFDSHVVPYVIIPVNNHEKVQEMLDKLNGVTDEGEGEHNELPRRHTDGEPDAGEGEGETAGTQANVFLVANFDQGGTEDIKEVGSNLVLKDKIIAKMASKSDDNPDFWYEDSDDDVYELKISYSSYSGTQEEANNDLKKANLYCNYVMNMFNCSKYEYQVKNIFVDEKTQNATIADFGVTYNYIEAKASGEQLMDFNNIKMSATLISTLVAIGIISLLLVAFYRVLSIGAIANTIGTVFLTFVLFFAMNAPFNYSALIAGIILAVASLFVEIVSMQKFKEEVYKGRSFKKANQEAGKRTNVATIDAAVVLAITGLMFYLLGGASLKPLGIILFFGGIITIPMNLIVYKVMNWLLCNTTLIQDKPQLFNLDEKYVSYGSLEAKQEFVAPYEKVDFTKKTKLGGIVTSALTVLSVAAIITFGVWKGSPLNVSNASKTVSTIYATIETEEIVTKNESLFRSDILDQITLNGEKLSYDDENVKITNRYTYDEEEEKYITYTVIIAELNDELNSADRESLESAIKEKLGETEIHISDAEKDACIDVAVRNSSEVADTPKQGFVALATGIAIVASAIYFFFRYKVSKGLALLVNATAATTVAYGISIGLSYLWPTTAITSLVMPFVALVSIFATIFYFAKEKELTLDIKEDLTPEMKKEITKKALSVAATPILTFAIVVSYFAINYFGFGVSSLAFLFLGILIGTVVAIAITLMLTGPLSNVFAKWFSKIKMPEFKALKKDKKVVVKKNSSEPEETIFIGIND